MSMPGVRIVRSDRALWRRMADDPFSAELLAFAGDPTGAVRSPEELTARQLCHVAHGLRLAREEGVRWLLHIDVDELFFPENGDVRPHFAALDALGIGYAIYDNDEAISEQVGEPDDPFAEMTLFKRSPRVIDPDALTEADRHFGPRGGFFLAYANGKAAARTTAGILPAGVHGFHVPRPLALGRCRLSTPAVLHYPYARFDAYWRKFKRLGAYSGEVLLGAPWQPPGFELLSRDLACADREAEARRLFAKATTLRDRRKIRKWIEAGVLRRIEGPARFFAQPSGPNTARAS